jgi:peptidyl-prolyl cis-trans isomerase C
MYRSFASVILVLIAQLGWSGAAERLFDDPVLAKAKSFEIRESDVQEAYVAQKAAAAALGQRPPAALETKLKQQILDKMIATRLLVARAQPQDRDEAQKLAQKLIADNKQRAGSDGSYRRRLLAVGSSPEKYEAEILEQATVQAVIDRELKRKEIVADADVKKFYEENSSLYQEAEKAKVAHVLLTTRKIPSGDPLPLPERTAKKERAEKALAKARVESNFSKVVEEFSEDPESRKKNGELTFARGSGVVPPQFEAAAFSLAPGQVSDLVQSVFGYHIIKLIEKLPAARLPLDKVQDQIRQVLQHQRVQEKLPAFVAQLRTEAGVKTEE